MALLLRGMSLCYLQLIDHFYLLYPFCEINNFDQVTENSGKALKVTKLGEATFKYAISDHYLTNPIARASEVMAELSKNTKERAALAVAAE